MPAARAPWPPLRAFAAVFAATLLAFVAVGAVLPVLPAYVKGPIGAGDVAVGVVVGAFAFSAVVGRPLGGRWADAVGRRRVVVVGLVLCAVAAALYLVPAGVAGLVVARLVLGIGDGWVFTAGLSWAVDLAPEDRRGQVIGIFGLAIWGGLSIGPVLGQLVLDLGSYEAVFAACIVLPLLGAALALRIPEVRPVRPEGAPPRPRGPLVPRPVVLPGIALALSNVGYGTVAGFVVLLLDERGVGAGATVFTAFAAAVCASRLLLSRLPDRIGPRRSALIAGAGQTIGLVVLAEASSTGAAFAGAVVLGIGSSLLFPSLALLVLDRVDESQRATAIGGFTSFFDVGVGLGAPLAGLVASLYDYEAAFLTAAACALLGTLVGLASSASPRPADGPSPGRTDRPSGPSPSHTAPTPPPSA